MHKLRTGLVAAGLVAGALLIPATGGPATAAQPANQACLGHDLSAAATADGQALGETFAFIARDGSIIPGPGAGAEVQFHMGGGLGSCAA